MIEYSWIYTRTKHINTIYADLQPAAPSRYNSDTSWTESATDSKSLWNRERQQKLKIYIFGSEIFIKIRSEIYFFVHTDPLAEVRKII